MTAPDEAIEAAAAAMWEQRPMQRDSDGAPLPFGEAKPYQRTRYIEQARAALEAGAPILRAHYLDSASSALYGWAQERMNADPAPDVILTDYEAGHEAGITTGLIAASLRTGEA